MLQLDLVESKKQDASGKTRFDIRYGDIIIVDILAKNRDEAEEKFLFTLVSGLRGKTIDFDENKLT